MLQATNISCQVGRKRLLDGVSLVAKPGQFIAIAGANGAGKSTLLKTLSRDLAPTTGRILLDDVPLTDYSAVSLARRRAVLAQQNPLAFNFRVYELVMMGRYPHFNGQPTTDDIAIVDHVHHLTGIAHLTDRSVLTLSGGEQQRVHLAKVLAQLMSTAYLANRPVGPARYVLLDEPTTGLDLYHQYALLDIVKSLTRQQYGVVAVLHDLNLVMQYADQVLLLKNGHSIGFGPPDSLLTSGTIFNAFQLRVRVVHQTGFDHPVLVPTRHAANSFSIH